MANGFIEKKETLIEYMKELKTILRSKHFNLEDDLDILFGAKEGSTGYKNAETIAILGYSKENIREALLSLTESDYSETLIDLQDQNTPLFYVFGKKLDPWEVYIKVKIRSRKNRKVFCISFHFAEFPITKPYSNREE